MTPLTPTERQQRWRAKKKAQADPVRAFVEWTLAWSEAEREAGAANARTFRLASQAAEIAEAMDANADPEMTWVRFAREHRIPGAFGRGEDGLSRQQATATLVWVNEERVAGRINMAAIQQGLRAAKALIAKPKRFHLAAIGTWMAVGLSGIAIDGGRAPADLIGEDEGDDDADD